MAVRIFEEYTSRPGTPQPLRLAGDYNNQPPPSFWVPTRWWTVTHWLIAVNVAVYVADLLSGQRLTHDGEFSFDKGLFQVQLWRWVTYSFLHASPEHLIFNMIALWAFGPGVESMLRPARYVAFYLLCGLGGILGDLLLWRLRFLDVTAHTTLVGASACICGFNFFHFRSNCDTEFSSATSTVLAN